MRSGGRATLVVTCIIIDSIALENGVFSVAGFKLLSFFSPFQAKSGVTGDDGGNISWLLVTRY